MQFKVAILVAVLGCAMLANGSPVLRKFTNQFNLDASVQSLFPAVDDLDQKLAKVSQCYEPELAGQNVDIFEREASIKSIVEKYYQAFPEKTISQESITNLIGSISEITTSCLSSESNTIRYGFTELSDMSDNQIRSLSGALPFNATAYAAATQQSPGDVQFFDGSNRECRRTGAPIPADFDWRRNNVVTPIRNQGQCGSCWVFAITQSIESSYLINHRTNDRNFELSEQQLTDCAKRDGCRGGFSYQGFEYARTHGVTAYHNYPYRANDNQCTNRGYPPAANIRDFCVRSKYGYNSNYHAEGLSDHDIQEALVNYGPLYILLDANPNWTRNYRGGIVTGNCVVTINHAVLLVGYSPAAWIIKNSWGAQWGEGGYFELARGRNLCGVNTEVAFPLL